MRRALTILLVLVVVVGGSLFAYRITAQEREPPPPDYEIIEVSQGDIVSTVSATGAIEPEQELLLLFKTIAQVAEVLVSEGDEVVAGQVLARLETDNLTLALAQAEVGLAISQAQLAKLKSGPTETDVATARAAVESAQVAVESARSAVVNAEANYSDLLAGPTEDEKQAAAANVERARIVLGQAQAAYDQVAHFPNIGLLPQSMNLQQATVDYELASANYRVATASPRRGEVTGAQAHLAQTRATLAQAEASLVSAQSNLERLLGGAAVEDMAIAEAQVTQAQLSVEQAKLALQNSELISPVAGIVSRLTIKPGEMPNTAVAAAVVTDNSRFHIDVQVDEIDIGKVREGQPVVILLDAMPAARITGRVDHITPAPNDLGGVVSFGVTVVIEESSAPLRSGLSATASITTQELRDVLVVPNRSIQIDRTSGRAFVEKMASGVPTSIEVQLGLRNEQQSQIISGLEAGDRLAIRSGTGLERLRATFFGEN